jgi:CoA:oxalate CoA-transferase
MCCDSLTGIRVVELGHFIAGPRCTQLLADHGAEVLKLEPLTGDPSRGAQPRHRGTSFYFASHNHRKKSVAVDLKTDRGQSILRRCIEWADVLVTNFSPPAASALGIDHPAVSAINPRTIVLQISAYGLDAEPQDSGGFDGTIQARSGIAHLVGERDGPPTVTAIPIVDHLTAIDAAYAVTLALRRREVTGVGVSIDVSLMDVAMSILAYAYGDVLVRDVHPHRDGSRAPYAFTTSYPALDGHVFIAPTTPAMWQTLSRLVGHPEWAQPGSDYLEIDARLRDRVTLEADIARWTIGHTRSELIRILGDAGVACGPMNRIDEAIRDPIVERRGLVEWVTAGGPGGVAIPVPGIELKFGSTRARPLAGNVPALGAETDEVLSALGYDPASIAELRADRIIA